MLPIANKFQEKGFGVVFLNPNLNSINEVPVEGSESPSKHLIYVVRNFIYDLDELVVGKCSNETWK